MKQPRDISYASNTNAYSPLKRVDVLGKPLEILEGKSNSNLINFIDKLYWVTDLKPPTNFKNAFFFNVDNDLKYFPFNKDFGPLNLAMVHRYSRELARLLRDKSY